MENTRGYFKLLTISGVPVYIHWTFPFGGLIVAMYAGMEFDRVIYYIFAYVLLVGLHEVGHLLAARSRRLNVYSIQITGTGGECRIQQPGKIRDVFLIYSAGVFAETIVLLLTLLYVNTFGHPSSQFGQSVINTFTIFNVIMIVLNLIPGKSSDGLYSDGYVLWKALLDSFDGQPKRLMAIRVIPPVFDPETRLLSMPEFHDESFSVGVEFLNDNATPMEFVVDSLLKYFDIKREQAIEYMLLIHSQGGALLPTENLQQAQAIAKDMTSDAREQGYPLVCRSVDASQFRSQPN